MEDAEFYYLGRNLDNEVYYQHYNGGGGKIKQVESITGYNQDWFNKYCNGNGDKPIPDDEPIHDYYIYNPRYKFVDWISGTASFPSSGMIFSKGIMDVLKKYKIDIHKIYPTIWERRGVMVPDYYYHLQLFGDQCDHIDFENSLFDIRKKYGNHELVESNVKIKDTSELVEFWKGTNEVELIGKSVTLKGEQLDLFQISILGWWGPIVTKVLKEELESISDSFHFIGPIQWLNSFI